MCVQIESWDGVSGIPSGIAFWEWFPPIRRFLGSWGAVKAKSELVTGSIK